MRDLDWMGDALCAQVDADLWHADGSGSTYATASKICRRCPVQRHCVDFAISIEGDGSKKDRHGLWGGATPRERVASSDHVAREHRHEAILRLVERGGMGPGEIADHVGVDVRTVYRVTKARREQMGEAA